MSNLSGGIIIILWIALSAFCWVAYHKLFDVVYFDLQKGLMKELIGSVIGGIFLLALICWVWWLVAIALGIIAVISFTSGKKGLAILCAVLIIAVAIVGIAVKNKSNDSEKKSAAIKTEYETILNDQMIL